jgi:hypothetical protein
VFVAMRPNGSPQPPTRWKIHCVVDRQAEVADKIPDLGIAEKR